MIPIPPPGGPFVRQQVNPLPALLAALLGHGPFTPFTGARVAQNLPSFDPSVPIPPPNGRITGDFAPGQSPFGGSRILGALGNYPGYAGGTPTPGGGVGGPMGAPDEDGPQGIVYGYRNGQTFYDTPAGRMGYALAPQAGVHRVGSPAASSAPIRRALSLVHQVTPVRNVNARSPGAGILAAIAAALAHRHG